MTHKQSRRASSLKTKAENDARSAVYLWLKRKRRHVLTTLTVQGAWPTIAREMSADGVLGRFGKPTTADNVRKTWLRLQADLEAEAATKAPRPARSYKKNVEPPSRPPPPDTGIRFPSALTEEPPGWRDRYPEIYGPPTRPADPPPVAPSPEPVASEPQLHPNPKIAAALKTLKGMGEYVPPPIVRGKII